MKINGNAIRPSMVIEHQNRLWRVVKIQHTQPGKGGAYAQVELKDIRDGTKLNERFRASETVEMFAWDLLIVVRTTLNSPKPKKITVQKSRILFRILIKFPDFRPISEFRNPEQNSGFQRGMAPSWHSYLQLTLC